MVDWTAGMAILLGVLAASNPGHGITLGTGMQETVFFAMKGTRPRLPKPLCAVREESGPWSPA
jgi:hypothetical protein